MHPHKSLMIRCAALVLLGCSPQVDKPSESGIDSHSDSDTENDPEQTCEPLELILQQSMDEAEILTHFAGAADDLPEHHGPGMAIGDLNQDGYLDALITIRSAGLAAFINDGDGQLHPMPELQIDGASLDDASGVALADFDNDGDLDAAIATQIGRPHLILENQGDGIQWTSTELENSLFEGITPSWADLDQDGRLDLVIPGFAHVFPNGDGRQHGLYMQQADGSFTDESTRIPEGARMGMGYVAQPFDVDADGDLDLYLINDTPFFSHLLINDGSGFFTDASDTCLCTKVKAAMGFALGDPNGDSLPDFFVTGWQQNRFFVNAADGSFYDNAIGAGLVPAHPDSEVGWGARFTDFNLDGRPDLAATFGGPNHDRSAHPLITYEQADALWIAKPKGGFVDIAKQVNWTTRALGRGIFVADMNRDHRPDIVLSTNVGFEIWLTQKGCGNAITLQFQGSSGDPHGESARVKITHSDGTERYEWMQSTTTFGNAAHELYLGSPPQRPITELRLIWSDGHEQVIDVPERGSITQVVR